MKTFDPVRAIFQERQKDLVEIANTPTVRKMLNFGLKARIIGVTPNAIIVRQGKKLRGEFISGMNPVARILLPVLHRLDITRSRNPQSPRDVYSLMRSPRFEEAYLVEYPAASGGTGGRYATNAAYATARGAASSSGTENGPKNEFVGGNYEIARWFCPTDFSAITPGSTVSAATGKIYPTSRNTTIDDTGKFIVTTQAATGSIAAGDYSALTLNSPTTYGTTGAWSGLTLNQFNDVTMDAGFLTLVQSGAGDFIKLGMRATKDIDNTTPANRNFLTFSVLDNERTKFDITWSPPSSGGTPSFTFFM